MKKVGSTIAKFVASSEARLVSEPKIKSSACRRFRVTPRHVPSAGALCSLLRVRTTSAGSKSALDTHFQSRTDWQRVHALEAARPVRFVLLSDSSTKHHMCPLSLKPHLHCRPGKYGSRSERSDELASSATVDWQCARYLEVSVESNHRLS